MTGFAGGGGATGPADAHFVFHQPTPSDVWVIAHDLDKHPSVTVVDSAGTVVNGDVGYDSKQQMTVTFRGAFSGTAYLN